MILNTCRVHPRYQAKRKPTADCRACRKMFRDAEARRALERKWAFNRRVYDALRTWFDTPYTREGAGSAVGQLNVHQTKLYDALTAIVDDARTGS